MVRLAAGRFRLVTSSRAVAAGPFYVNATYSPNQDTHRYECELISCDYQARSVQERRWRKIPPQPGERDPAGEGSFASSVLRPILWYPGLPLNPTRDLTPRDRIWLCPPMSVCLDTTVLIISCCRRESSGALYSDLLREGAPPPDRGWAWSYARRVPLSPAIPSRLD